MSLKSNLFSKLWFIYNIIHLNKSIALKNSLLLLALLIFSKGVISQSDSNQIEKKNIATQSTNLTDKNQVQQLGMPSNYKDSLSLAFNMIDKMEMSDLTRQRERFIYKVRIESYSLNSEILAYIEKRIKLLSK